MDAQKSNEKRNVLSGVSEMVDATSPVPEVEAKTDTHAKIPSPTEAGVEFWRTKVSPLLNDSRFRNALAQLRDSSLKTPLISEMAAMLMEIVPFLAANAVTKMKVKREDRERLWALGTGKTWKALTEFPAQLRDTAKKIKCLEGSIFFNPQNAITSKKPIATFSKHQFSFLPATLERYADWMEGQSKRIPALFDQRYPPQQHGLSPYVGEVSEMAKIITGRYCDNVVAEVLNEADRVLNPGPPDREDRFHPQTLLDFRSRRKRKPSRT